ncbi:MAG: thiol-disulfide oxidoreductase DCC family protein [Acidimicrobiales bacterium]
MAPPNRPVLVYDGDCAFCTRCAAWVVRRLPPGAAVEPWQALELDDLGLTEAEVADAAWWVAGDGTRSSGHAAIGQALVAIGGVWGLVGRALLVPPGSWLARPVYAFVARNRSKMPGGTPACEQPTRR